MLICLLRKKCKRPIRKLLNIFEFYKTTLLVNFPISTIAFFFAGIGHFLFTMATIGFMASILFKEMYRKNEYLFYNNNGISKRRLLFWSFLMNSILVLFLMFIFFLTRKYFE